MKRTIIGLLILAMILAGCGDPVPMGSNEMQSNQNERMVSDGRMQTGMPAIINFQELKMLKMIYELRDSADLICYVYFFNQFTGELVYLGQSLGYGIPYSTQFSNPEVVWMERDYHDSRGSYNDIGGTIPQPEPNGLFMPTASSATWILLIDPVTGEYHPTYIEPLIVVSQFPLT